MSELTCGQCGSHYVFRSHRHGFDYAMFWMRPYRCHDCKHRFFAAKQPRGFNDAAYEARKRQKKSERPAFETDPRGDVRPYFIRKA